MKYQLAALAFMWADQDKATAPEPREFLTDWSAVPIEEDELLKAIVEANAVYGGEDRRVR